MNIFANIYLQQCHTIYQTGTGFLRPPPLLLLPPPPSLRVTSITWTTYNGLKNNKKMMPLMIKTILYIMTKNVS